MTLSGSGGPTSPRLPQIADTRSLRSDEVAQVVHDDAALLADVSDRRLE
jgi:hypothetical protein